MTGSIKATSKTIKATYFRTETMAGWRHFTAASRSDAKQQALANNPTGYLLLTEHESNRTTGTVGKQVGPALINRVPKAGANRA